jgi:hypothetical protein
MRTDEIGSGTRSSDQTAAVVYALGLLEASGPILDPSLVMAALFGVLEVGMFFAGRMTRHFCARTIALGSLWVSFATADLIVSCQRGPLTTSVG